MPYPYQQGDPRYDGAAHSQAIHEEEMAQLKFSNPAITEEFAASMKRLGAPLPWDWQDGGLIDANGRLIAEFFASKDPDKNLRIVSNVVTAMNTCGGFKAMIASDELND